MQFSDLYQKAIAAQVLHTRFLEATEKNLSYYLFGKTVPLVEKMTFPRLNLVEVMASYTPEVDNPIEYLVNGFIEEIANSGWRVKVKAFPVEGKEPYQSYADNLESYLDEINREAQRAKYIKACILEILVHGYFSIYTTGKNYYFLSAYDYIPGDPAISKMEDQPFMIRRTQVRKSVLKNVQGIDWSKEVLNSFEVIEDLDVVDLLDVWSMPLDLNVCFTAGGKVLYSQKFPYPKRYPFAVGSESNLINSFYTRPVLSYLSPLLVKHQAALNNIEESSKSIANPILLFDEDAGIDINALQRALKEGYKRIIVGKNREGDLNFKAPGMLPGYSLEMPNLQLKDMMRHLGISEAFFGVPGGVRDRGAMGNLMKTTFRKLGAVVALLETAFTDIDNYLLRYLQDHQGAEMQSSRFKNIEQIFQGEVKYIAEESFKGFGSEDTNESKQFTLLKYQHKLIPQEEALEEMGHRQPRRLINKIKEEAKLNQEFAIELRKDMETSKSLLDQVSDRLKGKLLHRFYLMPIADDKVLVRCYVAEQKEIAFILSDLTDKILIETINVKSPATPEQKSPEVKVVQPTSAVEAPAIPSSSQSQTLNKPVVETRGRPRTKPVPPGEALKEVLRKISATKGKEQSKPVEEKKAESSKKESTKKSSSVFSETRLKNLISRSHVIRDPEKYKNLEGLYIVEPHAKWIFTGKKTLLVKAKEFAYKINKPLLLCSKDYVYGVITIRDIIENFDLEKTQKYHLVSPGQAKKWWKNKKLYLYLFEFNPFVEPIEYERPQGVQTFIKEVKFKTEDKGLPATGDLKPIGIRPGKLPEPHKPEKKAFQPHEVFSIERLKELIPEADYDISFKVDGLRARVWVVNGKAKMYSDTGSDWPRERIKPILKALEEKFKKNNVLLDGEIVMIDIRRKDIAGYIHGKFKPTLEQLNALRYICWDILYIKDKNLAGMPFYKRSSILDLYYPYKSRQLGVVQRVHHIVTKGRDSVGPAVKKVSSNEGAVIRDLNASYWATHSTYKCKYQFDIDAKVFAVSKTKTNLPIFFCELRDGTYIGSTYAQSEVKAKPGDVIRVNVDHVSILPEGRVNWYGPKPRSWKEGKVTPKKISTTQVGIGGADRLDLIKEIYLVTGGSKNKWDEWYPTYLIWKKEKMPALKQEIKKKVAAGIEVSKI